ncbi:methyltransferase [hydrocarbon metagenome]|uniref:Methyltransferase n=1 Tax=hydrocarbon metagenome TaxID=938273 RepID=A0A0W8E8M2_9ZZZZ
MTIIFKDEIAKNYDEWYSTEIGSFIDMVETQAALALFTPQAGTKILDAGCGTGNFSIKLSQSGCIVTGIDISPDMLNIARSKTRDELSIEYLEMDLRKLDFPDEFFDGVFSMAAFEFIEEAEKVYQELYRILKPGGKLLIGTINKDGSWGKLYQKIAQEDQNSVFSHAVFYNIDDLSQLNLRDLTASTGCLFIPPGLEVSNYTREKETDLADSEIPGFIITMWKKP